MPTVYLLDYVAGNIRSLVNAIEKVGYQVEWIRSPEDVPKADVRIALLLVFFLLFSILLSLLSSSLLSLLPFSRSFPSLAPSLLSLLPSLLLSLLPTLSFIIPPSQSSPLTRTLPRNSSSLV
jgi:hypothetical protein